MKPLSKHLLPTAVNKLFKICGVEFTSTSTAAVVAANPPAVVKKVAPKPTISQTTSKPSNVVKKAAPKNVIATKIVSFVDIQQLVYEELRDPKKLAGAQWSRFPRLNELLKGHRPGEMTVFTGTTGVGKTTFMSEYSLDLCQTSSVRTLWCSFEIPYVRLAKTMLHQHSRVNLRKDLSKFPAASTEFQRLPMYFLDVHGPVDRMEDVFATLNIAVQQLGIQHVIVDNLQFMIGLGSANSTALDRFIEQDKAVQRLRRFATQTKCHVTLVVHPRKEAGDELLTVQSIYGGGKVTQEADNVMILQKVKTFNQQRTIHFIEICKNRYDGDTGRVPLSYDSGTFCMSKENSTSPHIVVPGNAVIHATVSLERFRSQSNTHVNGSSDPDYFEGDLIVDDPGEGAISYLS